MAVAVMYDEDFTDTGYSPMLLPCGGIAYWDEASGIAYRCELCNAVVGSIGQPRRCREEAQKWDMMKALGGKGWDYFEEKDNVK